MWLPDRVPGSRWTSFVAGPDRRRILHERIYVELSGEEGAGPWTVLAVDRASRRYAVAQTQTQAAAHALTALLDH